jgi:flagellar hook-associated protein 3 FlgL
VADKPRALGGALGRLAEIERGLQLADQYGRSARQAATLLGAQQISIARIGDIGTGLAADLRSLSTTPHPELVSNAAVQARQGFSDMVASLNTSVAGRYVFAGVENDVAPLADADQIISALAASIPAGSNAAQIESHVQAWFAPGGGFDAAGHHRLSSDVGTLDLGNGMSVDFNVTTDERYLRRNLAALAVGALAGDSRLASDPVAQKALVARSADALAQNEAGGIALAARLGIQEARVAEAQSRAEARGATLEIARTELVSADPYETASALEAASQRLETIYLVTARLSRLSLTEYLR